MNYCLALLSALAVSGFFITSATGTTIYAADFSNAGEGSTHDTGADPIDASPITGTNWVLAFPAPSSDGTSNEFITVGGVMRIQDWGGEGTVTSNEITIASAGTVDITGAALSIGSDAFNIGTEGITWFYALNGSTTSVFLGETALGGGSVNAGTDVGHVFSSIAVEAGDSLFVGFTVEVDGADDGVEVSALTVDFTPVPEPTTTLLGTLGLLFLLRRRK